MNIGTTLLIIGMLFLLFYGLILLFKFIYDKLLFYHKSKKIKK
jgi:hypothetical protein